MSDKMINRIISEILFLPFRLGDYLKNRVNSFRLRSIASIHKNARLLEGSKIYNISGNIGAIQVGAYTNIRGELLTFAHGGKITIGEWCYIGEDTRIWSAEEIIIGNRVLIAHNVNIHDTNSHPKSSQERHEHFMCIVKKGHPRDIKSIESLPVKIEDDVWIGFNSIILKGVTIGAGSIVAAGSIVDKDIPPGSIFIQNYERKCFK